MKKGDFVGNVFELGMNVLSSRFWYIKGKIEMDWFNLSIETFKIRCKKLFLKNENDEKQEIW